MTSGHRVLVVDGLTETEEVLRAVLEPRGLQVDRVRSRSTPPAAPTARPSVIVLHRDEAGDEPRPNDPLGDVPRVIIGSAQFPEPAAGASHYLQQPFHYRELIAAIEQLLGSEAAPKPGDTAPSATLRAA